MASTLVRHVLVLKFVPEMTEEQFAELIGNFKALTAKIEGIVGFEYGVNNSPEGLDQGMTHVITLTFKDVAARDAYLPHPEHVKFAGWMGSTKLIETLLVVDYIAQA
jgi:hypothetical protein